MMLGLRVFSFGAWGLVLGVEGPRFRVWALGLRSPKSSTRHKKENQMAHEMEFF